VQEQEDVQPRTVASRDPLRRFVPTADGP
jgi:hypothetical protein